MLDLSNLFNIALLVFGFGFVVFWHELGHFLAAKWAGVKVEQFAVGFGQAMFSWRKGLGLRVGTSTPEFEKRVAEGTGADVSETEYRLNWIPLGGYVKMLGQDDMNPNKTSADPRSFNEKTIFQRMVIVSAGVVMNIILAAFGFTVVFLIGLNAPPAVVGVVLPGSPAALAGLRPGDRILKYDGAVQHDFTKIQLNVALSEQGKAVPVEVQRPDGSKATLSLTPARPDADSRGFLMIGLLPPVELRGLKATKEVQDAFEKKDIASPDMFALLPEETIVAVNGTPVKLTDTNVLDDALQASDGRPVELTVQTPTGSTRTSSITAKFQKPFGIEELQVAGLVPSPMVENVMDGSPARGKIQPGDVIEAVSFRKSGDLTAHPTGAELIKNLNLAGQNDVALDLSVRRGGELVKIENVTPSIKVARDRYGLGMGLGYDASSTLIAGVSPGSPAEVAGIPAGATIRRIGKQEVSNWFEVRRALQNSPVNTPLEMVVVTNGVEKSFPLTLTQPAMDQLKGISYAHGLLLHEHVEPRQTNNPVTATIWGVQETRDFTLQFYLTLQRMFQGSVSYTNMMGPVGIFHAGTKFAYKGTDWLIWFLAMISANLAVVNFLPIPIVDGGLFTFLIIEKLRGKPLSARAQSAAQIAGLALILGVFLLVTFQDIARFF